MKHLDFRRWKRRGDENNEIKYIQKEMDKWGALINFLYCSSYAGIINYCIALGENQTCIGAKLDLYIGILLLVCAVTSEYRQTDYEIILYFDSFGEKITHRDPFSWESFCRKQPSTTTEQQEETPDSGVKKR